MPPGNREAGAGPGRSRRQAGRIAAPCRAHGASGSNHGQREIAASGIIGTAIRQRCGKTERFGQWYGISLCYALDVQSDDDPIAVARLTFRRKADMALLRWDRGKSDALLGVCEL
jgi:hypothetical protein